jgi:hypothetical protein
MKDELISSVRNFVKALDTSNFEEARPYLSPRCRYRIDQTEIVGPEPILRSYAENDKWAKDTLERVVYESRVERISAKTFDVLYIDRIFHKGLEHDYQSHELLVLDDMGEIEQIFHEDIAGEPEALKEFFKACKIQRT